MLQNCFRCDLRASNIQNFLGGGPPNPLLKQRFASNAISAHQIFKISPGRGPKKVQRLASNTISGIKYSFRGGPKPPSRRFCFECTLGAFIKIFCRGSPKPPSGLKYFATKDSWRDMLILKCMYSASNISVRVPNPILFSY